MYLSFGRQIAYLDIKLMLPTTVRLIKASNCNLLTDRGCTLQTWHDKFEYERTGNMSCFLLVSGNVIFVCLASRNIVLHSWK